MHKVNSAIPRSTVAASVLNAWGAALAATSMLLLAPAVWADELICEVPQDGRPLRYLIDIDDQRSTVTVVNADTDKPYPVTVGELRPERVLFAFNNMAMDATEFVRQGRVVTMSLTTHTEALLDRTTNTLTKIGYVADDEGEILSLEQLRAMQAEEEARLSRHKGGPSHHPMFWLFLEAATFRYEGLCRAAERRNLNQ